MKGLQILIHFLNKTTEVESISVQLHLTEEV